MPNPREESFARASIPDITMITPQLYVGGHPPPGILDVIHDYAGISTIVSVARECPVFASHHPERIVLHVPLQDDQPTPSELKLAGIAARFTAAALDRGEQVLVTCFAGINRSAWIAGWALKVRTHEPMPGKQAIKLLRERRGDHLLCNEYFEDQVRYRYPPY